MTVTKILFVCHGNICRSTMAESVFTHLIKEEGLENLFVVDSAGTSREEIGNSPHAGTIKKLGEVGIPVVPHQARQMTLEDYNMFEYLIGMDEANYRNMFRLAGEDRKLSMLLDYADKSGDIADPWYTGNFEQTYEDVLKGCKGLLAYILEHRNE